MTKTLDEKVSRFLQFASDPEAIKAAFPDYQYHPPLKNYIRHPLNFITGMSYTGFNAYLLHMENMFSNTMPYYAGFGQIKNAGLTLQKGKGYPLSCCLVPLVSKKKDEETGEEDEQIFYTYKSIVPISYLVYDEKLHKLLERFRIGEEEHRQYKPDFEKLVKLIKENCEVQILVSSFSTPKYLIKEKVIQIPPPMYFSKGSGNEYVALLHELGHHFCDELRPDIEQVFGPRLILGGAYDAEEIIVETAAFLVAKSIGLDVDEASSSFYIVGYKQHFPDKPISDFVPFILKVLKRFNFLNELNHAITKVHHPQP